MTSRPLVALTALVLCLVAVPAHAADIPKPALEPYLTIQTALAADSLADAQKAAATFVVTGQRARSRPTPRAWSRPPGSRPPPTSRPRAPPSATSATSMLAWAGEGTGGKGVRVAYCPMVKKSWLQTGGEIANPYYGSGMLRCGSFTK